MDFKLCLAFLLATYLQVSDCLHYYKTPALDNQFTNFEITTSIPSDGTNGSQSIQDALLFKQYKRRYITFNFKGKGYAQLHFFYPRRVNHFKVIIGGGARHDVVCIYNKYDYKINSTIIPNITSENEYRSFYIRWKNPIVWLRVYVGLGSDPSKNHVLNADICPFLPGVNIRHILISTASDCLGEWQFATAGQMFGGCGNGTVCSSNSIKLECHNNDESGESKQTGLIGTCIPELVDFSNVTFGNGTFRKVEAGQVFGGHGNGNGNVCSNDSINIDSQTDNESAENNETGLIGTYTPELVDFSTVTFGNGTFKKATQQTTESYLRATPMESGCLVATIDRTLPSLVAWYSLWLLYGHY